ncbi:MAG: adenylate cyclase [Crocinitomix sp.]|jgi:adenylate cyclase
MKFIICLIGILFSFKATARLVNNKDSLLQVIENATEDSVICNAYFELGTNVKNVLQPEALDFLQKGQALAKDNLNLNHPGDYFFLELPRFAMYIGMAYRKLGNYPKALEYYFSTLKFYQKTNNSAGISTAYFNISGIYRRQNDLDKEIEYLDLCLAIRNEGKDSLGIINCYNSLGIIYRKKEEYDSALSYYEKSLAFALSRKDTTQLIIVYQNIGVIHVKNKELDKAQEIFYKALKIATDAKQDVLIANIRMNLSSVYVKTEQPKRAIELASSALETYKGRYDLKRMASAHSRLAAANQTIGNYEESYQHLQQYYQFKDELFNDEVTKNLVRIEMNHAFETEKIADSIEFAKASRIKDLEILRQNSDLEKSEIQQKAMYGGLFLLVIVALVIYRSYRRKKKSNGIIQYEKERSEKLLLNILPAETAEELKTHGKAKARSYEQVSVLFTDFKGFTMISEELSPEDLVAEIDHCYKAFDKICTEHNIEKIKTIGDAYMCAGGLPKVNDRNAIDAINAGLAIRDFMLDYKIQRDLEGRPGFEIRIGVHTGPVVAGIVGINKFAYDIWGDTVNTAARMESSGDVGKVNVSQTTYELTKDHFNFEYRGKIAAKNKGDIDMYFTTYLK